MEDLFSRPQTIRDIAHKHADELSIEFLKWLPDNEHIWHAFVDQAFQVIKRGFKHYSSKTIVEFLRHHTALQENSLNDFKINNNMTAYLPRLFDFAYPQHAGLFERRITKKRKGVNLNDRTIPTNSAALVKTGEPHQKPIV